jgi:aminopeptidase N
MTPSLGLRVAATLALLGVATVVEADSPSRDGKVERRDPHSFGNPEQIRVTHVDLDLMVDFEHRQLRGTATLTIERAPDCPSSAPLRLDSRELNVKRVSAASRKGEFTDVPFIVGRDEAGAKASSGGPSKNDVLGSPLTVSVPESARQVRITYATAPTAGALQWLEPPPGAVG